VRLHDKVGERFVFDPQDDNASFVLKDVVIGIEFHWERKEDQRFRGSLVLIPENCMVRAVNVLSLEDYLVSVIASEMSATSTLEYLKAHAVISRSWLLSQIEKRQGIEQRQNVPYTSECVPKRNGSNGGTGRIIPFLMSVPMTIASVTRASPVLLSQLIMLREL